MMRVAYFSHYVELYGANRSLVDLVVEVRKCGTVDPVVYIPAEGPLTRCLATLGIPTVVIAWHPWMVERRYSGGLRDRLSAFRDHVRQARSRALENARSGQLVLADLLERKVDLLHVNSAAVGIAGELIRSAHIPVVWHIREMPERHYGFTLNEGRGRYGDLLRRAARIIANSEAVRTDVLRYTGAGTKVDVVYNGVCSIANSEQVLEAQEARWSKDNVFTFLMAGVLHPKKGHREAIEALAWVVRTHPQVRLRVAGAGRQQELLELAQHLGVEQNVEFLGHVDDMAPFYGSGHALLMCSRTEGMGRVTVEAMANGLPVIGRAEGGTLELITQDRTGLFYTDGATALATAMTRLVADKAYARQLGREGVREAYSRFSIEEHAARVLSIYSSILTNERQLS